MSAASEELRDEQISGFIRGLRDDVTAALTALFCDPGVALDWQPEGDDLRLHFERSADGIGLRLSLPREPGDPLKASFEGRSPLKSSVARRFRELPERPKEVAALKAALDAWRPFRDMRDEQFRRMYPSPAGRYAQMRLAYACNQDCWFCWQGRSWPTPPPERYEAWLDEFIEAGVGALNLTGGEPTLHPLLPSLIERATAAGMAVSIQSNAIRLASPRFLKRLVDAGLTTVMVSYHSADSEISDRMTAAPGTHAKTEAGIAAALGAGLKVTLTCVVEGANHEGLAAHAERIVEKFIAPFPDNPIHRVTYAHPTSYFGREGPWEDHQVDYDAVRPHLVQACRTILASGVDLQLGGPCGFPVCIWNGADDLMERDVMQREYFDEADLAHRRYAPVCDGCEMRNRCFGLREEYLDTFGDRGLRPFLASTRDESP